ncbi:hypothetical protein PR202_gb10227 [Eleusine coracana subsp. coracana]|uniref:Transducin family protein / WD-40 repeat family protein n=1 Tax=Eleusine coracana subsp. coracana TaxID=191504 RepID=A0AAV5EIZ8_ELECO|nr:hypothetical protein PR202_gb10227 [Eleusine coracana subsp. coracana]
MADRPPLKRPKLEKEDSDSAYLPRPSSNGAASVAPSPAAAATNGAPTQGNQDDDEDITEEAVLALIAHRERDVERCKLKLLHYQSLLDTAEAKLEEAKARIARYRDRKPLPPPTQKEPKQERPTPPPPEKKAPSPAPAQQPTGKPQLVIPGPNTRPTPRPVQTPEPMPGLKKAVAAPSSSSSLGPPNRSRTEEKKPKRTTEEKEHQNLIPCIKKSSATLLKFPGGSVVPSQHRRKLRCLELCPVNDQLVATRAPGRQLRLFDIRLRQTEVHGFGWKQESSESQSALINQSWSPDGWYLSSGSADPVIHIFDISGQVCNAVVFPICHHLYDASERPAPVRENYTVEASGWSLRFPSLLSTATPTLSSSLVHRQGQKQRLLLPPSTWLLKKKMIPKLKQTAIVCAEEKTAVKSEEPSPAEEQQQSQPGQRRGAPAAGAIPNPFDFSTMMNLLNVRC